MPEQESAQLGGNPYSTSLEVTSPRYREFDIYQTIYKVVNGHEIQAFVLVPKTLAGAVGKRPIIVKFHGGGYVTGASLYPEWYGLWALEYAILHGAIIVTGDYRMLPEANATELYSDISSFFDWIRSDLNDFISEKKPFLEADLNRILVHGESAGGGISVMSGFKQPPNFIKAIIALYPGVDQGTRRGDLGPAIPASVLEDHLQNMQAGAIVTSAFPPERLGLVMSILQQGKQLDFFGRDEEVALLKVVEKAEYMPYTLVLHGKDDQIIPFENSVKWVERVRQRFGEQSADLWLESTAGHGFDSEMTLEGAQWAKEKLDRVTDMWLKQGDEFRSRE